MSGDPKPNLAGASPRASASRPSIEAFPRLVTVAREFASGGARISGLVAAELGLQLWDHELVSHLARRADVDPSAVREIDERACGLVADVVATVLHASRLSGSRYRALLARTMEELAERGGAVIVGRGANFLLRAEDALRVRIVCPRQLRIDRYARRAGVDWARAEAVVREKDRERERFARKLCAEKSTAAAIHYDLTLSTADLSEEVAAQLVVAAYRARFDVKKSSTTGRRSTPPSLSASV